MAEVLTVREAVERSRAEGIPISEYTLRLWVRRGKIPVRRVGQKILIYYPNLIRYLQCQDGADNKPPAELSVCGIRRVGV